jgi:hypothetical protein
VTDSHAFDCVVYRIQHTVQCTVYGIQYKVNRSKICCFSHGMQYLTSQVTHHRTVQYSTVQYCAVQCDLVQCSTEWSEVHLTLMSSNYINKYYLPAYNI